MLILLSQSLFHTVATFKAALLGSVIFLKVFIFKQAHRHEKDTLTHQISSYIEAKKIPKREKSPKNNYNNDTEDFSVFPFALCFRPCMKFSQMEKDSNNNSSFYRCDGKFEFIS